MAKWKIPESAPAVYCPSCGAVLTLGGNCPNGWIAMNNRTCPADLYPIHRRQRGCPECLGTGSITKSYGQGEFGDLYQEPCDACGGTGVGHG